MLLAIVLVSVAVLVVASVQAWHLLAWRRLQRRRVLVALDSGTQVSGVLWSRRGPLLVLRDVSLLGPRGEPVPADGELVVERPRVLWLQVLP